MKIERPDIVKVFAGKAEVFDYLPVSFGTNVVAKEIADVANMNFELGIESLERELELKDLNSTLFYHSALIKYLFTRGVSEYSAFEDYSSGSIVTFNNGLWIATRDIQHSLAKPNTEGGCANSCNPCADTDVKSLVCGEAEEPSVENGWCKFVTHCVYDNDKQAFDESLTALQASVTALKGVVTFSMGVASDGSKELNLLLSDGSVQTIKLDKFVEFDKLDTEKGFYFNAQSGKVEVDLQDLIRSGSGLSVDREGNISIDTTYTEELKDYSKEKANEAKSEAISETMNKVTNEIVPVIHNTIKEAKEEAISSAVTNVTNNIETKGTTVKVGTGLTGDGTINNPLSVDLGSEFIIKDGKISINTGVGKIAELIAQLSTLQGNLNNSSASNTAEVNALKSRLEVLEKPCRLGVVNVGKTQVTNLNSVMLAQGGILTFPPTLDVGKIFTVIQATDAEVELNGVISPNGNKIAGKDQAVTVIITATGEARAFGALKK